MDAESLKTLHELGEENKVLKEENKVLCDKVLQLAGRLNFTFDVLNTLKQRDKINNSFLSMLERMMRDPNAMPDGYKGDFILSEHY